MFNLQNNDLMNLVYTKIIIYFFTCLYGYFMIFKMNLTTLNYVVLLLGEYKNVHRIYGLKSEIFGLYYVM